MATLVNPAVFSGNELRTSETIGNKGLNALLGLLWDRSHNRTPSLVAFLAPKQYRIEEECSMRFDRFHRHNIHHPIHPFELEVEAVAKKRA